MPRGERLREPERGWAEGSRLRVAVGAHEAAAGFVAAIAVATLAGLWPAFEASRVAPAAALRYE